MTFQLRSYLRSFRKQVPRQLPALTRLNYTHQKRTRRRHACELLQHLWCFIERYSANKYQRDLVVETEYNPQEQDAVVRCYFEHHAPPALDEYDISSVFTMTVHEPIRFSLPSFQEQLLIDWLSIIDHKLLNEMKSAATGEVWEYDQIDWQGQK